MKILEDPRVLEYQAARCEGGQRYARSLVPFVEAYAETVEPALRGALVKALYRCGIPRAAIALGMLATEEEMAELDRLDFLVKEPEDEVARLRAVFRESYAGYLRTSHWRSVRAVAIHAAQGRCRLCAAKGPLQVHHATYERVGCEREADVVALCDGCHARFHGKQARAKGRAA